MIIAQSSPEFPVRNLKPFTAPGLSPHTFKEATHGTIQAPSRDRAGRRRRSVATGDDRALAGREPMRGHRMRKRGSRRGGAAALRRKSVADDDRCRPCRPDERRRAGPCREALQSGPRRDCHVGQSAPARAAGRGQILAKTLGSARHHPRRRTDGAGRRLRAWPRRNRWPSRAFRPDAARRIAAGGCFAAASRDMPGACHGPSC